MNNFILYHSNLVRLLVVCLLSSTSPSLLYSNGKSLIAVNEINNPDQLSHKQDIKPNQSNDSFRLSKENIDSKVLTGISAYSTESNGFNIARILSQQDYRKELIIPGKIPNYKFSDRIYWFHIKLEVNEKAKQNWYLVYDFPIVDSLYVKRFNNDKLLGTMQLGDHFITDETHFRKPVIPLEGNETHIWIRIHSTSSMQLALVLYDEATLDSTIQKDYIAQSFYYGALLAIFIYNLIISLNAKFLMYRYYIGFLGFYGLFQVVISGYGALFLWPNASNVWIDKSLTLFISLLVGFSYKFLNNLLKVKEKLSYAYKLGQIGFFINLPHIVAIWFLPYKYGLYWVTVSSFLFMIYSTCVAGYLSIKKNRLAMLYFCSWFIFIVGSILTISLAFGLVPRNFFTVYGQQLGSTLEFILLSLAMAYRVQGIEKKTQMRLSDQVNLQTQRLNHLQFLSQKIQNKTSLNEIEKNLKMALNSEFGIENFTFYVLNEDRSKLYLYGASIFAENAKSIINTIKKIPLNLEHTNSAYDYVIRKKKVLYLRTIKKPSVDPNENKIRDILKIKSIYLIPLIIDDQVFAVLGLSDTLLNPQNENVIRNLTKENRADIEKISEFVSAALYQALQKEQIKEVQEAASRAKNEAAINQLAAHLAHEVNNPLNYISTGKIIQQESFAKYHEMILNVLTGDDEESIAFKKELQHLEEKFKHGIEQSNEGQGRIAKVIAEIRAITGVDGLHITSFDLAPLLYEELIFSLIRNQITLSNLKVHVTGTEQPLQINSNTYILARSIRTVVSNSIHFARQDRGDGGELYIDCYKKADAIHVDIGNNSYSIKTKNLSDLFNLEKTRAHGTEQIGLGMIKELLNKINADLVLADHGRESGRVVFQIQMPLSI